MNSKEITGNKLHIGCGRNIMDGWINLDMIEGEGIDLTYDLELCNTTPLPIADDSIEEFLLSHVIEHVRNVMPMMQELYRVAKPGAKMTIMVPYGSSDDAFEDPTHVERYFINSFSYFAQPAYWRADYGYTGDWQVKDITLTVDANRQQGKDGQQILQEVMLLRNIVKEMKAECFAIKPIREQKQELIEAPTVNFALG